MPYITQEERNKIEPSLRQLHAALCGLPQPHTGQLNYIFSRLIHSFILYTVNGVSSYHTINEAIGLLECAKLELYRRIAAPYEDKKKEEHGDVYGP